MRGKSPKFPVENLNNSSVSFQVSVPFKYGIGIQPISLTSTEPAAGSVAVVSGWGYLSSGGPLASQLQAVDVFVTSRPECNYSYASLGEMTEGVICAAVPGGEKGTCHLDDGGPLVFRGELVGLLSYGGGCGDARYPAVYSNVVTIKDFIYNQTGVQ
jgi:trypsin